MGVAEEFDGEEGPLEEHIQRLTDSEKQVEVLKAALEAEKKKSASGDFCQIEKCTRHVDLWCGACETPMCYRCSSKIVCAAAEKHSLDEFDVIYKEVKVKFDQWREEQEEKFLVLEFRQKKMMTNIRGKERELSEASGESISQRADRLVEIAELMKKLEPLSLQLEEQKANLATYGADLDKLSKPKYLSVVKSVVDQTNDTASVSSYAAKVSSTAQPTVTKTPAQPRSLQLISKYDTDSYCWSVHHHSKTGDILVGCEDGVKVVDRQSGEIDHLSDYPKAVIREDKGEVFIGSLDKRTVNIFRFNMDNNTDELLFSYPYGDIPVMNVTDQHIACIDDDKNMKLYNRVSGTVSTVQLPGFSFIYKLQFLADDQSLLVTGRKDDKYRLNKYSLGDEGKPTLVWSCDKVSESGRVSVADHGLIFVCGASHNKLYTVSSEGKKMRDIKCDNLAGLCRDISIRGDELAVAGSNEGVFVYKILQ